MSKVGIAYPAFFHAFSKVFPSLEVVKGSVDDYDLIIFSGGEDISPEIYGEKNVSSFGINKERDAIELGVLKEAYEKGKKILGVCRGHQLINAFLGGKLIQNLYHPSDHLLDWKHHVEVEYTLPMAVNSMHHQGYTAELCSPKLTPLAVEPRSNLVEVARGKNIITVQFHPEFMDDECLRFFNYITSVETI